MSDPTQPVQIPTTPDRRPSLSRGKRRTITAAVVAILMALGALLVLDDGAGSASDAAAAGSPGTATTLDDDGDETDDIDDATEDALAADDDSTGYPDGGQNVSEPPSGGGDGGGDEPVELEPVGGLEEQCAQALATGAHLVVTPDPAVLDPGDMTSALTIRNCGDGEVDWTATTVPTVALDTSNSTLAGGATTELGFTIDAGAHEPGAVEFKIKVSEPGHNHYVDVQAFRTAVGLDAVAGDPTFTAGEGAGGCANSCITKAWLTPNANSANVGFEVETRTPARIRVWVGTQPQDGDGAPMATSAPGTTQWNTVLEPLQPGTTYHLLLVATDDNGNADERTTTFTTVTPLDNADDLAPVDPGCLAQCITTAILTPGADFSVKHLEVESTTRARFQASVSTEAPSYDGDVPSFDHADVVQLSGLEYVEQWSTDLAPLEGDTTYHIIVRAEDTDGHAAYQVGTFHTPGEPTHDVLITFHRVTVTHDGDSSWRNRGELSFGWAVGDTTVGTRGESKMHSGDGFGIERSRSAFLATGLRDGDFLPTVRVSGSERDADGRIEFCSMGTGVPHEPGRNDDCDAKWNVASSGLVTLGSIDSFARCSEHGLEGPDGDRGCMLLETVDQGDDYARFRVLVSFHVAG